MIRLAFALAAALAALALSAPASSVRQAGVVRVPQDVPTIKGAVALAKPGDTILVDRGTYAGGVVVPAAKPHLTIRGVDRNRVVLHGRDTQKNAIVVHANDVSILNMTAHNFVENGFYWDGVKGFRASYLTVWNVGLYGIYTEDASDGVIDHDYVSGAADAAYYIGECKPCRATISNVVAALSGVGYSGTNASGQLLIRDSLWDRNGAGILPNTYANEKDPPQEDAVIVNNTVRMSGRARVPYHTPLAGFSGIGIGIAGGNENVVRGNTVTGSKRYGIAVFPTEHAIPLRRRQTLTRPPWRARGNTVMGNTVRGSGTADLALSTGVGADNCFSTNRVRTTLPAELQSPTCPAATDRAGDPEVGAELTAPVWEMIERMLGPAPPPEYTSMPKPPPQPSMPQ